MVHIVTCIVSFYSENWVELKGLAGNSIQWRRDKKRAFIFMFGLGELKFQLFIDATWFL